MVSSKASCARLAGAYAAGMAAVLGATIVVRSAGATTPPIRVNRTSTSSDPRGSRASLPSPTRLGGDPEVSGPPLGRRLATGHDATMKCKPSPLYTTVIDPSTYEFGCDEIVEMLEGKTRLVGQGHWRDAFFVDYKNRKVVLRALREYWQKESMKQVVETKQQREGAALDAVRGHPQVVTLLGVCNATYSVTEYFGDNVEALLKRSSGQALPISKVLPMALDAARGLQALHEAPGGPIVHFDLKPEQLLLDEEGGLVINDLNGCKFMSSDRAGHPCKFNGYKNRPQTGWHAPEHMAGEMLTEKVDIYNMAMIMYEMISGMSPFGVESSLVHAEGETPFVDPVWHRGFMEILEDMWRREPSERPSAGKVFARLEKIQEGLWDR